ncbi:uncharacterized protein LOC112130931 isoform X1 [Pongo abelii]|uniref:uncharacterized protein LOC112130931 isoform X1 n=1 Tax=Pongo abelii TaxID=9601 RepID=UPI0023E82499|nr:uncharacterized protein LOC112130931 isoform X1 [Pongo abelii]XP_054401126.1 uncharacterized protein LOC112130931 isoform X1 [Pongo abelii]
MEDQLYPSSIWDNPFYQSTSHFQVAVALLFAPTPSVRQTASELVGRQHATGKIRRHGIPGSNGGDGRWRAEWKNGKRASCPVHICHLVTKLNGVLLTSAW